MGGSSPEHDSLLKRYPRPLTSQWVRFQTWSWNRGVPRPNTGRRLSNSRLALESPVLNNLPLTVLGWTSLPQVKLCDLNERAGLELRKLHFSTGTSQVCDLREITSPQISSFLFWVILSLWVQNPILQNLQTSKIALGPEMVACGWWADNFLSEKK